MYRQLEKNLLNGNISSTCPHNVANFCPLTAETVSLVWGTLTNFNRFRVLPSSLHRRRSPEANQSCARCLAVSWAGTLYIHFRGLLSPDRILPGAKFTLRASLAFAYIVSATARHSSSGRQPKFAAWYMEWNYGTFAEGATYIRQGDHHVGHRPMHILVVFEFSVSVFLIRQ